MNLAEIEVELRKRGIKDVKFTTQLFELHRDIVVKTTEKMLTAYLEGRYKVSSFNDSNLGK